MGPPRTDHKRPGCPPEEVRAWLAPAVSKAAPCYRRFSALPELSPCLLCPWYHRTLLTALVQCPNWRTGRGLLSDSGQFGGTDREQSHPESGSGSRPPESSSARSALAGRTGGSAMLSGWRVGAHRPCLWCAGPTATITPTGQVRGPRPAARPTLCDSRVQKVPATVTGLSSPPSVQPHLRVLTHSPVAASEP